MDKKEKALEPGASSAHSMRDIMMHSPHAYPGHCTCYVSSECGVPVCEKGREKRVAHIFC